MGEKESELKQVVIKESDWISGKQKPKKNYQPVIATDGEDIFMAEVGSGYKRHGNTITHMRIWQRLDGIRRIGYLKNEDYVKLYLPTSLLINSLPN